MDKTTARPTTFREKKRYWRSDGIIKDLNKARNALYHAGFDAMAADLTREMHKRFEFLERYTDGPKA